MPDHSFSKEIFPNVQSEPPLTQLEAIASRPVAGYWGEETNTRLTTASSQVSPQPSPDYKHLELYLALWTRLHKAAWAPHPFGTAPVPISSLPLEHAGRCIPKPIRQFKALRGPPGHTVPQPPARWATEHLGFYPLPCLHVNCHTEVSSSLGRNVPGSGEAGGHPALACQ